MDGTQQVARKSTGGERKDDRQPKKPLPKMPKKGWKKMSKQERDDHDKLRKAAGHGRYVPNKCRPGTAAMRTTERVATNYGNNLKTDPTYRANIKVEDSLQTRRFTRSVLTPFLGAARNVPVLVPEHDPDTEAIQYNSFRDSLINLGVRVVDLSKGDGTGRAYQTAIGSWYNQCVRHLDGEAKRTYTVRSPDRFWQDCTKTYKSAAIDLRSYMASETLPIAIQVAQYNQVKREGHCQTLILYRMKKDDGNYEWRCFLKESLNRYRSTVSNMAYLLLKEIGIPATDLITEMPMEEEICFTDCIRESYNHSAKVLEGIFPALLTRVIRGPYRRTYTISTRKFT